MEIHAPCGAKFDLDEDEQKMLAEIRKSHAGYGICGGSSERVAELISVSRDMLDFFAHVRFRRILEAVTGHRDVLEWDEVEMSADVYADESGCDMRLTPESAAKIAEMKKLAESGAVDG